tara:strand:- start:35 stop:298 length:264 start_codon:yes stop_codon:yes gene_type:complete
MVIKNSSFEHDIKIEKYGKYVSVNMGTQYAVVSCTKHHLSDFVKVVDELSMKGWVTTSGLTSEDGKVFQAMSKSPSDYNNVYRNKGV